MQESSQLTQLRRYQRLQQRLPGNGGRIAAVAGEGQQQQEEGDAADPRLSWVHLPPYSLGARWQTPSQSVALPEVAAFFIPWSNQ